MPIPARSAALCLALAAPLMAQAPKPEPAKPDLVKLEADVQRNAAQVLTGFAHTAEGAKMQARARAAWQLILDACDPDHAGARTALGFRKDKGQWVPAPAAKQQRPADTSDAALQKRVADAWTVARRQLVAMHRDLAQKCQAQGQTERANAAYERLLRFDPDDVEAHKALGHAEYQGYYGPPAELAFLERMATLRAKAKEVSDRNYEVKPLGRDQMPLQLQRTGLEMTGAKSRNFTVWAHASQEETQLIAAWGERALDFLLFLLDGQQSMRSGGSYALHQVKWFGVLHGDEERDLFLAKNPEACGGQPAEAMRRFSGTRFNVSGGQAFIDWSPPENDHDRIVAEVADVYFAHDSNPGLGQGFVHAVTWFLLGTTLTWFGSLPQTETGNAKPTTRDPKEWLDSLRQELRTGEDWPLDQVPREQLSSFRHKVRVKSWYFMVWLLARYPGEWARLLRSFPGKTTPLPEECQATFEKVLGAKVADLQAEWQLWASGESRLAKASGCGL